MNTINVDFSKRLGKIKPMHCVNNGPDAQSNIPRERTNLDLFEALHIPFARNHDAAFNARYGLDHTVDVHLIFRDFSADECDPASYDFTCTDDYIKMTESIGTHHFYRLGTHIEHEVKKYGTVMPPDFHKWARICEHIIMHYTEGWADGFYYDMPYWEIWNEPDLDRDDSNNKRCWSGTAKEFYELFNITLTHLKGRFPHLKIGGPAMANPENVAWTRGFLDSLGEVKPDFFSWHIYFSKVESMLKRARLVRELLDEYGLTDCESILNEWNYVKDNCWVGPYVAYSTRVRTGPGAKCSAYISAAMLAAQHSSIDMLMLYDARPCSWCPLFEPYVVSSPLKGYYSLKMFSELYRLGNEADSHVEGENIYALAAEGTERAVMIASYVDDDEAESSTVTVNLRGLTGGSRIEYYLLDEDHTMELLREEFTTAEELTVQLSIKNYSTYFIKIVN